MAERHDEGRPAATRPAEPLSKIITRIAWLCMLPLFLFAVAMTAREIGIVHRQQAEQASLLAKNFVVEIDHNVQSRIDALNVLANSPLMDDDSRWNELHREALGFHNSFGTHVVITDGGTPLRLLLNTRVPFGTKMPPVAKVSGRLAGPIAMKTGKPAVGDLFEGPVIKEPMVGIAVPVLRGGKATYAVTTTIDRSFFQKRMDDVSLPPGWAIVLKDAQGGIIAGRPRDPAKDSIDGSVAHSKISGWTVSVRIPGSSYWRPLANTTLVLGGILIVATFAGFLGGRWAGRRLGRSVASLVRPQDAEAPGPGVAEFDEVRRLLDDQTRRRSEVESTLRESEERYRSLFHNNHAVMLLIDPADGRIVEGNPAACAYYGYPAERIVRLNISDINMLPPDLVNAEMQRAAVESRRHFQFRHLLADGRVRDVEVYSGPIEFAGRRLLYSIVHDVTESRRADEALRESERRLSLAVSATADAIWEWNLVTDRTYYSPRWYEMLGYGDKEIPMDLDGWKRLCHPDDLLPTMELIRSRLESADDAGYAAEFRMRAKNGSWLWILGRGRVVERDAEGKPFLLSGTNADVTARKQAEEALMASLAEKEVLLKEIHHRVKNNLQVVSSLIDLQAAGVEDPAMREVFRDMNFRVRSMAMIHEKLYGSVDLAHVEFSEYVESLLDYVWKAQGADSVGVRRNLDLKPVRLPVNVAVPGGLILNELFSNAFKHAFRGRDAGNLGVSLREDPEGAVCLVVHDDGPGLPPSMNWETTRSLGLRIVKILARQLRADVTVKGDGGTRFEIRFRK